MRTFCRENPDGLALVMGQSKLNILGSIQAQRTHVEQLQHEVEDLKQLAKIATGVPRGLAQSYSEFD